MGKLIKYDITELSTARVVEEARDKYEDKLKERCFSLATKDALFQLLQKVAPELVETSRFRIEQIFDTDGKFTGVKIEMLTNCEYESD